MSYTAGICAGMASLGFTPGPPHITCDGCGVRKDAMTKAGGPAAWLLARKAPPGWKLDRRELDSGEVVRLDWCPRCRSASRFPSASR